MSEIMLAKSFDSGKLKFPVEVTVKLDGVAADFYKMGDAWVVQSRQGKPILSVGHILRYFNTQFKSEPTGTHVVGELTVMGVQDFKDAGGIIRRKEEDRRIILNIYDVYRTVERKDYEMRSQEIEKFLKSPAGLKEISHGSLVWNIVKRVPLACICKDMAELTTELTSVDNVMSIGEGFVIRSLNGKDSYYNVGKRSWGMQKYKPKPTVDLHLHSVEEAIDKHGNPKGMVGRINCWYKGDVIGVGPGCLTHSERTRLFKILIGRPERPVEYDEKDGPILEVEYMLDASYEALRQPVFKRWRLDKDEESLEA